MASLKLTVTDKNLKDYMQILLKAVLYYIIL